MFIAEYKQMRALYNNVYHATIHMQNTIVVEYNIIPREAG